jgi:hypothetical protein
MLQPTNNLFWIVDIGAGTLRKDCKDVLCKFCSRSAHTLTLHPTPYTLHPTPYTLHPTPYTLHPTPYTLHPTPYTLRPHTLRPKPETLCERIASFQAMR